MKSPYIRLLVSVLLFLPLLYFTLFFIFPVLSIIQLSLWDGDALRWEGFERLATDPYFRELLWFTLWQAALSTGLTMAAGMPAAYAFARLQFPGKTLLRALLTVPFVLPTVVVATAFLALLGPRGRLNLFLMSLFNLDAPPLQLQQTLALILLAHVFYNVAVVIRMVGGFWSSLDPQIEEAASMLGARPRRVFREITLPLLMPAVGASALLVFLFTFSSFGVILILGGLRFATIEVEIYRQAISLFNLPVAASLSLLQMALTFILMLVYTRLQARASVPLHHRSQRSVEKKAVTWRSRLFLLGAVALPALFTAAPLFALVERSLVSDGTLSLEYYRLLGESAGRTLFSTSPLTAVRNSLGFAISTMALSLIIGVLASYLLSSGGAGGRRGWRAILDPLFLLPLGTSAVTLGFGFLIALDEPPLNLRTSVLLVPLAHSLIAFPFVVRAVLPVLRSIHPSLREVASVMGASPFRLLREIDLPILRRSIVVGAVFAFAISMGEFGATALIARPEWPTIPVVIFQLLGRPGLSNYAQALAMSVILMSTTIAGFVLIERLRTNDMGEF